jgi:CheY-like chemotaxis protein
LPQCFIALVVLITLLPAALHTLGEGSTFWFVLKLEEDKDFEPKELSKVSLKGLRTLVVDDDDLLAQAMVEFLHNWGMEAVAVESAQEALALLEKDAAFDLILCDYVMPEMDGLAFALAMKEREAWDNIKRVIFTRSPLKEKMRLFKEAGFNGYMMKPVWPERLKELLEVLMGMDEKNTDFISIHNVHHAEFEDVYAAQQAEGEGKTIHVLVAEDNKVKQLVVKKILEKLHCVVAVAGDGKEALEKIAEQEYDFILMDCQMPEMDGFEATQAIREQESQGVLSRQVIIALTANAMKGDKKKCLEAGMDDYIAKPLKQLDIERVIRTWVLEKPAAI